ncbi:MAG: hypothetical protein M0P59_11270 [Gallionella sp.]|nr:hypothetical protein [Gallionella sp.]
MYLRLLTVLLEGRGDAKGAAKKQSGDTGFSSSKVSLTAAFFPAIRD